MKIKFDYDNVEPEVVAEVLQLLMNHLKRFKEEDSGTPFQVDFGPVNLYLTVKDNQTGNPLRIGNGKGKELEWTVKPEKMSKTVKRELMSNEKYTVYTN